MKTPFTNSSMSPTSSAPSTPALTSQYSRMDAPRMPTTPPMMKADRIRRGESAGLGSWSRYHTTAVTGTMKLPSITMVGSRITLWVRAATAIAAIQSASPMRRTPHQAGTQRSLFKVAGSITASPPGSGRSGHLAFALLDALARVKHPLAHANRLWGHLDQFVIFDEVEALFERHLPGRDQFD